MPSRRRGSTTRSERCAGWSTTSRAPAVTRQVRISNTPITFHGPTEVRQIRRPAIRRSSEALVSLCVLPTTKVIAVGPANQLRRSAATTVLCPIALETQEFSRHRSR